jgi:3-deoxy-D-manno-octulosonic-acid transferase
MSFLYDFSIQVYFLLLKAAAYIHPKAKLRLTGLKQQKEKLKELAKKDTKTIWMHCASLGEFEQGRPLLEKIREQQPDACIVLTFYSPSGYEKQKNYYAADYVFYLPEDTKKQAEQFIRSVRPQIAIFVKYEFWYRHLQALHMADADIYLIAGIFRKNQIFFKSYGKFFRNILNFFKHFYVQNRQSADLLSSIGYENYSIAGDPRFDRVLEIAQSKEPVEGIANFKADKKMIVAGSTWRLDEKLLAHFAKKHRDIKIIFAPHEIHPDKLGQLEALLEGKVARYSKLKSEQAQKADYLIIDNIGMLSKLYRYADVCYIGGGFGAGIHNVLEAAVYGKPVVFGPKHQKFSEARELKKVKAAFAIHNQQELTTQLKKLLKEPSPLRETAVKQSEEYCRSMAGSTKKIYHSIFEKYHH